jgi:hypothetical protein
LHKQHTVWYTNTCTLYLEILLLSRAMFVTMCACCVSVCALALHLTALTSWVGWFWRIGIIVW